MRIKQRLKTICDVLFALAAAIVCSAAVGYLYDCYYDLNDDVMIKDILSGTYTGTPEGRNIQMLYPIGLLISAFYRILPALPWYGIFLCACHVLCFFLIGKRLISFTDRLYKKGILLVFEALMFVGLLLRELVYVQYSVTCALLVATGIFLFYTTEDALSETAFIRKNIVSILLVVAGFYVRTEMMLLLMPLVGAAGIAKWTGGAKKTQTVFWAKKNLIKYLTVPLAVVAGMGIGLAADAFAYGGSAWGEFRDFFAYRTELYDFQEKPPDYQENRTYYENIGLADAEVELLVNYNFSLDEKLDAAMLKELVAYNRNNLGVNYYKYGLYEGFRNYLYRIWHAQDGKWIYVIVALYLLTFFSGMMHWDYSVPWKLLLLGVMRTVSWMYLIMRGRTPRRITDSLCLCETLILSAMLIQQIHALFTDYRRQMQENTGRQTQENAGRQKTRPPYIPRYRKYWPLTAVLVLTGLTIVPAWNNFSEVETEQRQREEVNREWDVLRAYFAEQEENFYLVDVYSTVQYSEPMFLRVDNGYRNYDICGGWSSKSPIYAEKLRRYGIGNVESDLYHMNNFYFVSRTDRDTHWLIEYYRCKGYDVRLREEFCVRVGEEPVFMIYKVCQAYESSQYKPGYGQGTYFKIMVE